MLRSQKHSLRYRFDTEAETSTFNGLSSQLGWPVPEFPLGRTYREAVIELANATL